MNILVVDDEKDIVTLYKKILEASGNEVTMTTSPEEALGLIAKSQYDLVITDKKMPQISGAEIIELVEATSKETIVFMITGDNTDEYDFVHEKSRVLKKPVSLEALSLTVNELS
jgi:two-component system NtrC family response regulator